MVRRSGFGVPFSTVSPNSFAKARTSVIAAGSALCCWRYWARVRRSWPRRLVLSGFLRRTTTETVKTLLGRAGFSLVAAERGAFSLPVSTTRCWEEKREEGVLAAAMGSSPKSAPSYSAIRFQGSYEWNPGLGAALQYRLQR